MLGLHTSISLEVDRDPPAAGEPCVAVYLGSESAATDPTCEVAVRDAIGQGMTVLPVVADLTRYTRDAPAALRAVNGFEWTGDDAPGRLARCLLQELGIEERQRRVFVSHRRSDGMHAARQLYDHLRRHTFEPFVDRFDIRPAAQTQARIAEALEECAFLLLLETPEAHLSDWVEYEVDYAMTHSMGIQIVTWPGDVVELPASHGLPRERLESRHLVSGNDEAPLTDEALDAIAGRVEAAHANALFRRRKQLLRSVQDAAVAQALACTPLAGWRLLVEGADGQDLVAVTGRLPAVEDLYELDRARSELASVPSEPAGVLVHAARQLDEERRRLLTWAAGARQLTLVPENAIGGYW